MNVPHTHTHTLRCEIFLYFYSKNRAGDRRDTTERHTQTVSATQTREFYIQWSICEENISLMMLMFLQVSGVVLLLLRQGQERRERGFTQHLLLNVARILHRFQRRLEKREQGHSAGEVCALFSKYIWIKQKNCVNKHASPSLSTKPALFSPGSRAARRCNLSGMRDVHPKKVSRKPSPRPFSFYL